MWQNQVNTEKKTFGHFSAAGGRMQFIRMDVASPPQCPQMGTSV